MLTGEPDEHQRTGPGGNHALRKADVVHLDAARGRRIESVLGHVWITIDGDPRDIVLDPGEGFEVVRDGAVLISALRGDARFVLLDPVNAV